MRIILCDSSLADQEHLAQALGALDSALKPERCVDGASLLAAAQEVYGEAIALAFVETCLPDGSGIDTVREFKRLSPKTEIVFVTHSRDHAVDAFSLHCLHYLLKPVTAEALREVFRRLNRPAEKKRPLLLLSTRGESRSVYPDEILYVQSDKHMKELFLTDGGRIRVWMSMDEVSAALGANFLRLSRGTLVNMEHIARIGPETCVLRAGIRLELPRRERPAIRAAFEGFLLSRRAESHGEK